MQETSAIQYHSLVGCERTPILLTGWKQTLQDRSLASENNEDPLLAEAVGTLQLP